MKCIKCGKQLGPEERLLSAIFGESTSQCCNCARIEATPKCHECGQPTDLAFNGEPTCPAHFEVAV